MNRPRPVAAVPPSGTPGKASRKPDPAVPLILAAFALGIVVASVAALGMRVSAGDTVPSGVHERQAAELAAARATTAAQDEQISRQAAALDDADVLARRLVAALDSPTVTPEDLAALRRDVTTQTRTIERVRVVRVPVPGPVVTAPPVARRPQPARQDPRPAPVPTSGPACALELLGVCLAR